MRQDTKRHSHSGTVKTQSPHASKKKKLYPHIDFEKIIKDEERNDILSDLVIAGLIVLVGFIFIGTLV